eukprot:2260368-Prymnesium_polylepis.2
MKKWATHTLGRVRPLLVRSLRRAIVWGRCVAPVGGGACRAAAGVSNTIRGTTTGDADLWTQTTRTCSRSPQATHAGPAPPSSEQLHAHARRRPAAGSHRARPQLERRRSAAVLNATSAAALDAALSAALSDLADSAPPRRRGGLGRAKPSPTRG